MYYTNVANHGRNDSVDLKRFCKMEKEIATHSSILAWKSPWTEEPGGLQSMGLHD